MNSSVFSRLSATLGASTTRTTYARLALARFYATKKGKKAKSPNVAIDHDLAEGLVDLEKLKATMQKTVGSLQLEFKDKLTVSIQPNVLDKLKVQSQNGKETFPLSQVAQIKLNDSMFVIDLRDSPEVRQYFIANLLNPMCIVFSILFVFATLVRICQKYK
ncbi:uncharacterized protein LOC110061693 [Orbicella faveolata]|uniref:uncharacterized protein LOC110061693 n=1 Tax=Orbicella faveolata TaxID=48498 RepID=UPI0009E5EE10|nr:uncharacterized protein LOC110061693 [Orbicella faveolata]